MIWLSCNIMYVSSINGTFHVTMCILQLIHAYTIFFAVACSHFCSGSCRWICRINNIYIPFPWESKDYWTNSLFEKTIIYVGIYFINNSKGLFFYGLRLWGFLVHTYHVLHRRYIVNVSKSPQKIDTGKFSMFSSPVSPAARCVILLIEEIRLTSWGW